MAPPAAPASPVTSRIEPGVPSAEVPVSRDTSPPSPPSEDPVRMDTLPLSENLEGEVWMKTELLSPLSVWFVRKKRKQRTMDGGQTMCESSCNISNVHRRW